MASKKYNVGIIGYGWAATAHIDAINATRQGQVTAVFDLVPDHPAHLAAREFGLTSEDDLVLRRAQAADGRTRAFVNDQPATAQALRAIGRELVEIHCQHDDRARWRRQLATIAAALERLAAGPFDILFTDIVMPGNMDGVALVREALLRHTHLRVVLTSGYAKGLDDINKLLIAFRRLIDERSRDGTGEVHEGKPGGFKHGGRAHHAGGGKVHHISGHPEGTHAHHKAMAKHYAEKCADGGSAHHHKMHEHHKHMAKMCKGGSYAVGGEVPADSKKSMNKGKIELGGTIEDNEHYYENTDVHTAVADKAHGTGGVSMSNAGGFKHGGKAKMHHKATGGAIPAATMKNKREDHLKGDTYEGGN